MMTYAVLSKKGEREINEDSVKIEKIDDNHILFALADGLGGHGRGEVASGIAVDQSGQVFSQIYEEKECLEQCFTFSQEQILEKQAEDHSPNDLKTTLVLLSICNGRIQRGYIGDSRLYYFEKNKLIERTKDHSVPQMLVGMGEIKEKEIRGHADRNRLLRVMGIEWEKPQYVIEEELEQKEEQAFLLCSDGFWEWIEEKQMISCLKKAQNADQWLSAMEKIVLEKGTGKDMDNYSAIAVMIRPEKRRNRLWQL